MSPSFLAGHFSTDKRASIYSSLSYFILVWYKNISLWASIFLFEILYYTEFLYSCLRYYILRWASIFHFELLYSCSRYYILLWASIFYFELLYSCSRYYILLWASIFLFEILYSTLSFYILVFTLTAVVLQFQH